MCLLPALHGRAAPFTDCYIHGARVSFYSTHSCPAKRLMMEKLWRSPDGERNAIALRTQYELGFTAIAEYDRIGHLLLHRAGNGDAVEMLETVVGVAMLRRAVMLFTGIRTLLEHSLPDVAKAPARAYFELWLQHRCLAYGSVHPVLLQTPTLPDAREPRAKRYHVAAGRRALRLRALALRDHMANEQEQTITELEQEAAHELSRLRHNFPEEWVYFGDVTDARFLLTERDPQWFSPEFPQGTVSTVQQLAAAYGYGREYDLLYDAFSALMHSRGMSHDLTIDAGVAAVHLPHDPAWFQTIAWFVLRWHQMLLFTAAKWHAPLMMSQLRALQKRHEPAIESLSPDRLPNLI